MLFSKIDTRDKRNNLTMIRILAALSVTFGHSFVMITGSNAILPFGIGTGYFGFMPVALFFALSGYLVTQSFCHSKSWLHYLVARMLRIYPGLLFANLFAVLLVFLFVHPFSLELLGRFFIFILEGFKFGNACVSPVFKDNTFDCVNGSLWTLGVEFRYYILVLLLGVLGVFKKRIYFLLFVLSLIALAVFAPESFAKAFFGRIFKVPSADSTWLSLILSFTMGMFFYFYKDYVYLSRIAALLCLVGAFFSPLWWVKVILLVYSCFVFGLHPKCFLGHNFEKYDMSYGIYVLSYPVQQVFIYHKISSPWILFALASLVVLPVSMFSWKFIEEPALQVKTDLFKKIDSWRLARADKK